MRSQQCKRGKMEVSEYPSHSSLLERDGGEGSRGWEGQRRERARESERLNEYGRRGSENKLYYKYHSVVWGIQSRTRLNTKGVSPPEGGACNEPKKKGVKMRLRVINERDDN